VRTLPGSKPIQVLLVDDDPGNVRLTIEVLKESELHTHIDIVEDGREVLAFDMQPS
jgi:CheY-like chemotaxis protein